MTENKAEWTREELIEQLVLMKALYKHFLACHMPKERLDREIAWLEEKLSESQD